MHEEGLFPREGAFHSSSEQERRQRRLGLVGHVFFAAESAPVGDLFDDNLVRGDLQNRGDLIAIVPDPLASRVDLQDAVRPRNGEGRLGL